MKEGIIKLNTVDDYNRLFGLETLHPLVNVIDLSQATSFPAHFTVNYGVYALFLKETKCGDIRYGRQPYDYQEGTITSFAPGQVTETDMPEGVKPKAKGIVFHPDLIKGTSLGQEIRSYSFFSYDSREALHLSDDEKTIILDCLSKIRMELTHPIDKLSRRLISRNIQLLLDYCMRFYNRQFVTRTEANKDVLTRFEHLLDNYFQSGKTQTAGIPTVRYFAEAVFLSPNYFGDLVKKETGKSPQEYIQAKIMDLAKDMLLGSEKSVSQIAYDLGFQYSQHFNRVFKRNTGLSPNEYRKSATL
jgi:AraC-like DNA-binding protein